MVTVWIIDLRRGIEDAGDQLRNYCYNPDDENGVKEQVVGDRDGEKRPNPGYILKVEGTDFLRGLV